VESEYAAPILASNRPASAEKIIMQAVLGSR
jgi:hypothetical protein